MISGVLLLDKPAGYSSNQALGRAKRLVGERKAGHTGTLDPFATGLLPICFGEATKFSADLLEAEGFATVQASDAAQAIAMMRREPAFDVLVTDLSMPGADGITLIQQARQVQSEIPAILLTGYAERVASVAVGAAGNFRVLRKPVEGDRLVDEITILMQSLREA